jgi:hypothetical protein
MAKYTLQQEIAALETLKEWIGQARDKQSVVSTIFANILNELSPGEVSEVLMQYLAEHLENLHDPSSDNND